MTLLGASLLQAAREALEIVQQWEEHGKKRGVAMQKPADKLVLSATKSRSAHRPSSDASD